MSHGYPSGYGMYPSGGFSGAPMAAPHSGASPAHSGQHPTHPGAHPSHAGHPLHVRPMMSRGMPQQMQQMPMGYGAPYVQMSYSGPSLPQGQQQMPAAMTPMPPMTKVSSPGMTLPSGTGVVSRPAGAGYGVSSPQTVRGGDTRMTISQEAVSALLLRNAELLKEWHRIITAVIKSNASEPTREQAEHIAKIQAQLGSSIRLLAAMADTNSRFSKFSKSDIRAVFNYDDEITEPLRALIWTDEFVERQKKAAAPEEEEEASTAAPLPSDASEAAPAAPQEQPTESSAAVAVSMQDTIMDGSGGIVESEAPTS